MATYAPRPPVFTAIARRARTLRHTWIAVPLGLAGLIAVSLMMRTGELGIGFWIDEGLSVGIADRPLTDIPAALRKDGSPPLYYMLLHFWLGIAGDSEEGVRSFSLACALLTIPVGWWAGKTVWGSNKAGWFAAVLMAFNPFLSQYAQEARMYAMVALLAIPVTVCFLRAYALDTEHPRRWAIGFAVAEAVALYTHNWPIFYGAAAGVAWLVLLALSDRRGELFKNGLIGFGGAALLYLPWVPTTLYQAQHTGAPWADAPALSSLFGVPGVILGRLPEIVFLICAGAGLIAMLRTRPLSAHARAALALLIIAVLTPTLAWTLSQSSPAWANRYLAVAVAPYLLLATGGLAYARRLGVFGLVLVVIMWAQDSSPVEKSNVRAIAHAVGPSLQPGDLVISTQPETIPVLHYYLPEGLRYATLTGEETDFGVWDWRDGVERLEATSAQADLAPLIASLKPGTRVVLVEPIVWTLNRWRAPWTKLIRIRSKEWSQWLSNDPSMQITSVQPTNFTPPRPNPVRATVMVKTD